MSLITPINPSPLHPSPFSRGYFWQEYSYNRAPGEVDRGPPGRVTHEEQDMVERGCRIAPQGLLSRQKDLSDWLNRWPLALSVILFLAIFCLFLSQAVCPPLYCWFSICLSVCMWLSIWTFLRDIWGGHKAEEVPNNALRLRLISKATRMCPSLCFSQWTVYCWSSTQKAGSHIWPIQNFAKNDCSPLLIRKTKIRPLCHLAKMLGLKQL